MHPNDPNNQTDHDAMIQAEADAIMAECCDLKAAYDFADNWKALLDVRGELIFSVCRILSTSDTDLVKHAAIGNILHDRVRRSALKRAEQELP